MQITTRHTTITTHTPTPARVLATQELAGGGGATLAYMYWPIPTYLPILYYICQPDHPLPRCLLLC